MFEKKKKNNKIQGHTRKPEVLLGPCGPSPSPLSRTGLTNVPLEGAKSSGSYGLYPGKGKATEAILRG